MDTLTRIIQIEITVYMYTCTVYPYKCTINFVILYLRSMYMYMDSSIFMSILRYVIYKINLYK